MLTMRIASLLAAALVVLLTACATESEAPTPSAMPDLEATVRAVVNEALPTATPTPTPDIDATVVARMAATTSAMLSPTPTATSTPTPMPTATPMPTPLPTPTPTVVPTPTPTPMVPLSDMVRLARPAVVRIQTGSSSGSGVIFETQGTTGYVITNHHVVEGDARVNVIVNDSATYQGTVLGSDAVRDLAVVRICCASFRALSFGNAAALQPGDEVVNIGYALGLPGEATVTRGIISAVRYDSRYLSNVIQTDAAINPGNSGGPMLSTTGEILGINTFRISETNSGRSAEGLGFAISGTTVQQQIPMLKAGSPAPIPTPTRRPATTPVPGQTADFGPTSGELKHEPTDGLIKVEFAGVSVADMIAEATFVNPYSAASNDWDYGFLLRVERNGSRIHLVLTSDQRWVLNWRETPSADTSQRLGGGTLETFNTGTGGRNHLRVVAIGERGWLFVNGEFVSTLDLSDVTDAGEVAVITGAFTGNEVAGAVTRFENFKGDRLSKRYGPADGKLEYEQGLISGHDSGVRTRDLVVEAEFVNPPGDDWDYGFIIRNPEFNRLDVVTLVADSRWFHHTRDIGDAEYTDVDYGRLSGSLRDKNHLLIIAVEESGWFLVNGRLEAKLDLGRNLDAGDVSAMGGFFNNHTGEPEFEDFIVWVP